MYRGTVGRDGWRGRSGGAGSVRPVWSNVVGWEFPVTKDFVHSEKDGDPEVHNLGWR